ncbi:tyrosine-type recombinase/integrase [Paenibacillus albus]|uniref:Integrase n=1 Tax=Paenibacillus albus TaxID=2495582 RepID=A0A3Q8X3C6_9BACL|nr:site-specific integrase [Paenibacillus albus]AZN39547.1 hypothetical protein EJC50_07630 [Paenibacillus albus]
MAARGWIKSDDELSKLVQQSNEILNKGAYFNLMQQLNCTARHTKGGLSIKTQRQYYHHMDLFIRYLSDNFGTQNLANISGKHIAGYVEERQSEGKSASTIALDLCAIRYFHDQMGGSNTRHRIPNNTQLQSRFGVSLESRVYGKVVRRWAWEEVNSMIELAEVYGRSNIAHMLRLAAELGLRIHEIVRLSQHDLKTAIRTCLLHVKGKNGLERDVPLRGNITDHLRVLYLSHLPGDTKVFVDNALKAHQVIQSVQSFIYNHQDQIAVLGIRTAGIGLTFHGLRHLYSYERYHEFCSLGYSQSSARLKVAALIGHSREEITNIYIG